MDERRSPWLVSGVLLICAGLAGAVATHLWWLPCRGQMVIGTPLGPEFSDHLMTSACTDRMNEGTPFPLPTEASLSTPWLLFLSSATMLLVALAWLVPVLRAAIGWQPRVIMALPAAGIVMVAGLGVGIAHGSAVAEGLAYPLDTMITLVIVPAVVIVIAAPVRRPSRFLVAALAVSSMGFFGAVAEYLLMASWSDAAWDAPPGSGYLTAGLLVLCGATLLVLTLSSRPRPVSLRGSSVEVGQEASSTGAPMSFRE